MKIYNTQEEVDRDIKNNKIIIAGDVKFNFFLKINASIIVTRDITAGNITARDITALNITARDITARDITALNITAGNINFYAVCFAYLTFICSKITGRRTNSRYFCLDSEVKISDKICN